ncbi:MAG: hypothetical protein Kow0080_08700 [Candidatus Promineifilaceae bacterium]
MPHGKGLNKVMLIGWVDGDPELRYTPGGKPVAALSVATPRSWTSAEGETHEEMEWFSVVAWGPLAEICHKRLYDGQRVYVEGRLQTRGWEDEYGRKHFRTEVVAHEMIALSDEN